MERTLPLPQELIDMIIDHLHYDKHTLQHCSLVCKAWFHSARYHLFYYYSSATGTCSNCNILSRSRSVAIPFIRTLFLERPHPARFITPFRVDQLSFLDEFENLKSISITPLLLIPFIAAELVHIKTFTCITRLKIDNLIAEKFSHIAQFVCAFPRLETLVIGTHQVLFKIEPSRTLHFPRSLRSLGIHVADKVDVLEWLVSRSEQPALHTICLAFHQLKPSDEELVNSCLRTLGPTLEAIGIATDDRPTRTGSERPDITTSSGRTPALDLARNTRLRFVYLSLQLDEHANGMVVGTLSQIVSRHVEMVELTLIGENRSPNIVDWEKVDEILSARRFSVLRRVRLGWVDLCSLFQYDAAWFKARLPRCHARDILAFPDIMPSERFRSCVPSTPLQPFCPTY